MACAPNKTAPAPHNHVTVRYHFWRGRHGLDVEDRRGGDRWPSLLGAHLRGVPYGSDTACLVRNRSADGLRLDLSDAVPLPALFDLYVHKTGQTRQVYPVWRGNDQVGVRYVPVPSAAEPVPIGLMRELRDARAEIASLRDRLARLGDPG